MKNEEGGRGGVGRGGEAKGREGLGGVSREGEGPGGEGRERGATQCHTVLHPPLHHLPVCVPACVSALQPHLPPHATPCCTPTYPANHLIVLVPGAASPAADLQTGQTGKVSYFEQHINQSTLER